MLLLLRLKDCPKDNENEPHSIRLRYGLVFIMGVGQGLAMDCHRPAMPDPSMPCEWAIMKPPYGRFREHHTPYAYGFIE
jgi:hypothetical protein